MAGNYVEELVAFLGWEVDSKELSQFDDQVKKVTDTVKGVALAVSAAAAGVAAFVTITNRATAVTLGQARANNVAAETAEDLGRMLSIIGMDTNSVIKSFAFLNKTMGGLKTGAISATMVDKSLKGVGLRLRDIQGLTPEQQFITVMEAARGTEDAQVAAAAATALFGREAGKMAGYFRTQTKTVAELLEIQNDMNLQMEEGRQGALRFFGALDLLEAAGTSVRESLAGLIGRGLSPMLESMVDWIAANRELLQLKIAEWADRITKAFTWFVGAVKWVYTWVSRVVDGLGGLENVMKLVAVATGAMFTVNVISSLATFVKMVKAAGVATTFMNAAIGLTPIAIAAVIALLFLLGEDLYQFFTGGESLLGELGDKIAEFAHMNIRPFIASLLGMTPEELDLAMVKVVNSVTNFFTKQIPDAYNWLINKTSEFIETLVNFFAQDIPAAFNSATEFFKSFVARIADVFSGVYDAIVKPFADGLKSAKGLLSRVPVIGERFAGSSGVASPSAVLGASVGLRSAAAAVTNNTTGGARTANVNAPITINASSGTNPQDIARRVRDAIGNEVRRAVNGANSGREV